jgi:hypothetical protein
VITVKGKDAMTLDVETPARMQQAVAPVLLILVSVPTLLGWIPMNGFYGIRVRQAFASDASWYAINRLGSLAMIGASFIWIAAAVYAPIRLVKWIGLATIVLAVLGLARTEGWTL